MNAQLANTYEAEGYVNRPLYEKEIVKYLDEHGNYHCFQNGKLMAGEIESTENLVDTTGWQLFDLLAFLNY